MPEPPRAPHAVQISLGVLGEVEVDDNVDGLDVDPSCEQICKQDESLSPRLRCHLLIPLVIMLY